MRTNDDAIRNTTVSLSNSSEPTERRLALWALSPAVNQTSYLATVGIVREINSAPAQSAESSLVVFPPVAVPARGVSTFELKETAPFSGDTIQITLTFDRIQPGECESKSILGAYVSLGAIEYVSSKFGADKEIIRRAVPLCPGWSERNVIGSLPSAHLSLDIDIAVLP